MPRAHLNRADQAAPVLVRPFGGKPPVYRVHFAWSPLHERWVNAALGCTLARYPARRHQKNRLYSGKVRRLLDRAWVRPIEELLGRAALSHPWLEQFAAREPVAEKAGYVYVYARKADLDRRNAGVTRHVLLHKVGLTTRDPRRRIAEQELANKEPYSAVAAVRTAYPRFLERHVHGFLGAYRVYKASARGSLSSGGTEWFLVEQARLVDALARISLLLDYVWGDPVSR